MLILALRSLLFYSSTFVFCALALLECTIIGDEPEGLPFDKTELLRIGKLSPKSSFMLTGRIQITRVSNEDESETSDMTPKSKVYLEFSSDFNLETSTPDTDDLSIFLSDAETLGSIQFQVASLQSLSAYQSYAIDDASEIRNIEMGVYSHVLLHSVGTSTTVASAMLEGIPAVDTPIFNDVFFDTHKSYKLTGSIDIILKPTEEYLVRFNSDFSTREGPGVYVYLIEGNSKPTKSDLELGSLKSLSGEHGYAVPKYINIFPFAHVLVHCKPFNIPFGWAALKTIP